MARGQEISAERAQLIRQVSVQSCPAPRTEDLADKTQEAPELEKCKSAPTVPQWLGVVGADIKVRNTFLHVEMDEEDEEVAFLQACRRRDIHSCPFFSSTMEPAPEESPRVPTIASTSELFVTEPAVEPSPEQPVCQVGLDNGSAPRSAFFKGLAEQPWVPHMKSKGVFPCPVTSPSIEPVEEEEADSFRQLMACAVEKHHARGRRTAKVVAQALPTSASSRLRAKAVTNQAAGLAHTISKGEMSRHSLPSVVAITPAVPRRGRRSSGDRLWCHVFVDARMLKPGFDLVKKLIGKNGCNTRGIFETTRTKVRVRGRGSGHMEERTGDEAPVPLMVALAAQQGCEEGFCKAFEMTKELLQNVSKRFEAFLRRQGADVPTRPLFSLSETSKESLACLSVAALDGVDVRVPR